jgi:hypothetical protein
MSSYPRVDRSHIVPVGYLRRFAVDGKLMMHLVGKTTSRPISPRDAGVRGAFYRRTRPDGTTIDDVEWSLSQLENNTLPLLPKVRDLWPLTPDVKQKIAQLFGYQFVRGPHWRTWYERMTRDFVTERVRGEEMAIRADESLATEEEVQEFEQYLLGSTPRTTRMLSLGPKIASLLGSMHWTLIEFHSPLLATSDHPVVLWPLYERSSRPRFMPLDNGMFATLEIRAPISPRLAVVMTWLDDEDTATPTRGSNEMAANLNAFTIAQAEVQWFHSPERVPPRASGQLLPLSPRLSRGYGPGAVLSSRRRQTIQEKIQARIGDDLTQDVEIVVAERRPRATTS